MRNKNTQSFTHRTELLIQLFIEKLKKDGDMLTYEEIKKETGLDVRSGKINNAYAEAYKAREACTHLTTQQPFFVVAVHGEGLERVRIGKAWVKSNTEIHKIRRKSQQALSWLPHGVDHAVDDEEALANRTSILLHTSILSKSHADAFRAEYAKVSSGQSFTRPLISLRDLLKREK